MLSQRQIMVFSDSMKSHSKSEYRLCFIFYKRKYLYIFEIIDR